jgi:hypothetical protein
MIERIASVRHKDGSITVKPFWGEDFETAEQAARDWVSTIFSADDNVAIEYEQYFLLSIDNFVQRPAARVVRHSRVLSAEDREFLAGCRISAEGL